MSIWVHRADWQSAQAGNGSVVYEMVIRRSTSFLDFQRHVKAHLLGSATRTSTQCFSWKTRLYPAGATLPMWVRSLSWPFVRTKVLESQPAGAGPRSFLRVDFWSIPDADVNMALGRTQPEDEERTLLLLGMIRRPNSKPDRPLVASGVDIPRSPSVPQLPPPNIPLTERRDTQERQDSGIQHPTSCTCPECFDSRKFLDAGPERSETSRDTSWIDDETSLAVIAFPKRNNTQERQVSSKIHLSSCRCSECDNSHKRLDAGACLSRPTQETAWIDDQTLLEVNVDKKRMHESIPKPIRNSNKLRKQERPTPQQSIRQDSSLAPGTPQDRIADWEAHQRYKCSKGCGYCKEARALGLEKSGLQCCMQ